VYPFKAILVGNETSLAEASQGLRAYPVQIEATFPDANAAIDWLSNAPAAKHLFVVHLAEPRQLDSVRRLRGCCVGQPILVLMPDVEVDKEALMRLMRAGVDQAVLLPLQPDDFQAALESLAWQFGYTAGQAPLIAIVGVAEGSGVSTLSINLAYEIAYRKRECILVEMTSRLGKFARYLGVTPRFTTRELAEASDRLDSHMVNQALMPITDHLRVLAAPANEVRSFDPGRERICAFFMHLRQLTEVSILEMSYNITPSYYATLAVVDQVLVVGQHAPQSLHDLKLICQLLRRDYGIQSLYPVVNRYDKRSRDLSVERMQDALEERQLLTIAFDRSLARAKDSVPVLRREAEDGPAHEDIQSIARMLLHEPEPPRPSRDGLRGWLARVFSGG
jgi:Flp pilus assembly CpaE family ATPase